MQAFLHDKIVSFYVIQLIVRCCTTRVNCSLLS